MPTHKSRHSRPSGAKQLLFTLGALIVLLTYPVGVVWTLLASQSAGTSAASRLWHALGWPLVTFIDLMEKGRARPPRSKS